MNTLEIIVLIFAILTIGKAIALFSMKQKSLKTLVDNFLRYKNLATIVLIIGIPAFGYLLMQNMPIVHIMAGVILGVGMIGLFLIQYPQPMAKLYKEMFKNKFGLFLGFVYFLVLSIWVILELFL